jgi:ABC-type glycerol-3-phosphate transport system substrate-binding protein
MTGDEMSQDSPRYPRHEFLRRGVALGAAVGAGSALGVPGAFAAGTRPSAAARGAASTITYATDVTLGPLLTPFIKKFNKEHAPLKAGLSLLSGSYPTLIATRFAGGGKGIDMVFSDPGYAELWYKSGWIQALDGLPGLKALNADIAGASLKKELFASDGKQIAIPYYSGLDLFVYNKATLAKYHVAPPNTWDELTTACTALKKAGVQFPFSPFWDKDFAFIFSTFLSHCASEGMTNVFSPDLEPTFDKSPIALNIVERWRKWYQMGFVSSDVLTGNYTAVQNSFTAGKSAFAHGTLQFVKPWQTTKNTPAFGNTVIALMPGKTRSSVTSLAKYHMTTSTEDREATWEFMKFLAWRDSKNKNAYTVPYGYLVKAFALTAPYKGLLKYPEVKNAFSFVNFKVLQQQSAKAVAMYYPADTAAWFTGFQNKFSSLLQDAVLGNVKPQAALKQAADYARSKNK